MPRKRLTIKQKEFVNSIVKTKNATESVMQVYKPKSREVAKVMGSKMLTSNNVAMAVRDKLEVAGLTDSYLDSSMKELITTSLLATKTASFSTALEAIKHVNLLKDRLPATKSLVASLTVTHDLDSKDFDSLKELLASIQQSNKEIVERIESE